MANEFVIKNGYFSQGDSNVTGSLSVTQNVTASKALFSSSGVNQLMVLGSGSSSWLTGIYGSQGNLLTITDTFSGSIFTVSDISGYPILDVTSDYYTSSVYLPTLQSQSQQHVVVYNSQSGLLSYVSASTLGGGGSGTPGGLDTQVQFNSGGLALSGSPNFTFDYNTNVATITGSLQIINSNNNNTYNLLVTESNGQAYIMIGDKDNSSNLTHLIVDESFSNIILRADSGIIFSPNSLIESSETKVLVWNSGTGRVYYTASSAIGGGGSGTPGGSNRQIQFNANNAFSGSSNFTFDSASNTVTITGSLTVSGSGTFTNIGPAIFSGSVNISGSITASVFTGSFTGSLLGTASYVTGSIFTSTNLALSASNALTASYALGPATFGVTIDGAGGVISAGQKGYVQIPYACTINSWRIIANTAGSTVIDVWKTTAPTIPTSANSITGSAPPTLTAPQQTNASPTLTGWTTSVAANDIIGFNVNSATTISWVTLQLFATKT